MRSYQCLNSKKTQFIIDVICDNKNVIKDHIFMHDFPVRNDDVAELI